jgi:hypothetical protein
MSFDRQPIAPARMRRIDGSFAFLPHRFLRDGFLQSLPDDELRLYLVLVLAADRDGISFYSHRRLCEVLGIPPERYLQSRDSLERKDLIATDGARVQVLSLPPQPRALQHRPMSRRDQASACQAILDALK